MIQDDNQSKNSKKDDMLNMASKNIFTQQKLEEKKKKNTLEYAKPQLNKSFESDQPEKLINFSLYEQEINFQDFE